MKKVTNRVMWPVLGSQLFFWILDWIVFFFISIQYNNPTKIQQNPKIQIFWIFDIERELGRTIYQIESINSI
jgi:hypothetical protein